MGYQTNYKLTTVPADKAGEIRRAIIIALDDDGWDPFDEPCKWYEHEDTVRAVSEAHPDVVITVHGKGEDAGDQWVLHAFRGEVRKTAREKWTPPAPPREWLGEVER